MASTSADVSFPRDAFRYRSDPLNPFKNVTTTPMWPVLYIMTADPGTFSVDAAAGKILIGFPYRVSICASVSPIRANATVAQSNCTAIQQFSRLVFITLAAFCLFCFPHSNDKVIRRGRNDAKENIHDCRSCVSLQDNSRHGTP
jgi:hypothetical protein